MVSEKKDSFWSKQVYIILKQYTLKKKNKYWNGQQKQMQVTSVRFLSCSGHVCRLSTIWINDHLLSANIFNKEKVGCWPRTISSSSSRWSVAGGGQTICHHWLKRRGRKVFLKSSLDTRNRDVAEDKVKIRNKIRILNMEKFGEITPTRWWYSPRDAKETPKQVHWMGQAFRKLQKLN